MTTTTAAAVAVVSAALDLTVAVVAVSGAVEAVAVVTTLLPNWRKKYWRKVAILLETGAVAAEVKVLAAIVTMETSNLRLSSPSRGVASPANQKPLQLFPGLPLVQTKAAVVV